MRQYYLKKITCVVRTPTKYGAKMPGTVATVFNKPNNIPEYEPPISLIFAKYPPPDAKPNEPTPMANKTTPAQGFVQSINVNPIVKHMGMNKPKELNSLRVIVDVIDFERIILSAAMLALFKIQ